MLVWEAMCIHINYAVSSRHGFLAQFELVTLCLRKTIGTIWGHTFFHVSTFVGSFNPILWWFGILGINSNAEMAIDLVDPETHGCKSNFLLMREEDGRKVTNNREQYHHKVEMVALNEAHFFVNFWWDVECIIQILR